MAAAVIRLVWITGPVFHHDEGVNGSFMIPLWENHSYRYDPTNYHGPSLYYLTLPFIRVFGMTDLALRLCPAVFGILVVGELLLMQRAIGRVAAFIAALLWTFSPGAVYISRYFIHEMLFLAFTLGMILPLLYRERLGRMAAYVLTAVSAALLFASKETAIMTVIVMLAADWLAETIARRLGGQAAAPVDEEEDSPAKVAFIIISASCAFVVVFVLLYSSFFTNPHGVADAFRALQIWRKTGSEAHVHPFTQYLTEWMWPLEAPIELFGFLGVAVILACRTARTRYNLFLGAWACGMFLAYSVVRYKTPWLQLNITLPLSLTAGVGLATAWTRRWFSTTTMVIALCVSTFILGGQAVYLSDYAYDDDSQAYVYAHSKRDLLNLVAVVDQDAKLMGKGNDATIAIVSPEYWPLPWYLRNYRNAAYWAQLTFGNTHPDMVIACQDSDLDQEAGLKPLIGNDFELVGKYILRPGVTLLFYVRRSEMPGGAAPAPSPTPQPTGSP